MMEKRHRTAGATLSLILLTATLTGCDAATEPVGPMGNTPSPPGPSFAVIVQDVTDLGTLGGNTAAAFGVNHLGQVVGESETASGDRHPFLWDNSVGMTPLGTLGGDLSSARDINDVGQVVGVSETPAGDRSAVLWENGALIPLGTLGGDLSSAQAINDFGQTVGFSATADGDLHAFLWENGVGMTPLGTLGGDRSVARGINNLGQVVGESTTAGGDLRGFLWEDGEEMTPLPTLGGDFSAAFGINDLGQVVGESRTADGETHAVLWEEGVIKDLGTLGGTFARAVAINSLGQVVGQSFPAGGTLGLHAFLWQDGLMFDLGASAGGVSEAWDVEETGDVVGFSQNPLPNAVRWIVPIAASVEIEANKGNAHTGTIALTGPDRITTIVHGNPWFDATNVDPATVTLGDEDGNDTGVAAKKNGDLRAKLDDADRDGHTDLVLEFSRDAMLANGDLSSSTQQLFLLGDRFDGRRVRGIVVVNVVP